LDSFGPETVENHLRSRSISRSHGAWRLFEADEPYDHHWTILSGLRWSQPVSRPTEIAIFAIAARTSSAGIQSYWPRKKSPLVRKATRCSSDLSARFHDDCPPHIYMRLGPLCLICSL
jgi:hypothetical protein